jgi:hypothetical protein
MQWSSAEALEQRALLSASNGMSGGVEQMADVSYADDSDMASDMKHHKSKAMTGQETMGHDMDRSIKMASHKRQGAQTKVEIPDFSGDWFLGFGDDPPSPESTMTVEQNGKKITATIQDNDTEVLVKGKIKQGELRAKFNVPGEEIFGTFEVRLTAADEFDGTLTINAAASKATFTQAFHGSKTVVVEIPRG